MNAISPFLHVEHYSSTFATLGNFQCETAQITWKYDDCETGHYIEVRRRGRWDFEGEGHDWRSFLHVNRHFVDRDTAPAAFARLVAAALRCAPCFIPAEW